MGVTLEGTVSGVAIGSHSETPGLGANATKPEFLEQFLGGRQFTAVKGGAGAAEETSEDDSEVDGGTGATVVAEAETSEIDALTGATITSNAVANAVNLAVTYYNEYLAEGV